MTWRATSIGALADRHRRAQAPHLAACGPCPHGAPHCPCRDGGICLYSPVTGFSALPCPRTRRVGCMECV